MRFAVLLLSYDHIADVKISMRLIKKLWSTQALLQDVDIYHSYNGPRAAYPKPYLEKRLIRRKNLGHYQGAADLMNVGLAEILASAKKYEQILVMSGDVWLIKPEMLARILTTMVQKNYQFAASLWPNSWFLPTAFSSEFFIISPTLAKHVFPLNLELYLRSRPISRWLAHLYAHLPWLTVPQVELDLTSRVLKALNQKFWMFNWANSIYLLPGRRMVFGLNRYYSPKLGYLSHHQLSAKIQLCLSDNNENNHKLQQLLLSGD